MFSLSSNSLSKKLLSSSASLLIKRDFRRKVLDNSSTLLTKRSEELIKKRMFKLMKRIQSTGNKTLYDEEQNLKASFRDISSIDRIIKEFEDHSINEIYPVPGDVEKLFIDYLKGTKTSLRDFDFEMSTIRYLLSSKDVTVSLKFLDYYDMDMNLFNDVMDFLTLHGSFTPSIHQLLDFALKNPLDIMPGSIETLNAMTCRHGEEMKTAEIIGSLMLFYRAGYYPTQAAFNRTICSLAKSKDPLIALKVMNLFVKNELIEMHLIDPFTYNMLVENISEAFATAFVDLIEQYKVDKLEWEEGEINHFINEDDKELLEKHGVELARKELSSTKYRYLSMINYNVEEEFIQLILNMRRAIEYFNDESSLEYLTYEIRNKYLLKKLPLKKNNFSFINAHYLPFTEKKKKKKDEKPISLPILQEEKLLLYEDSLNQLNNEVNIYKERHLKFKDHIPSNRYVDYEQRFVDNNADVTPLKKIEFQSLKAYPLQSLPNEVVNYDEYLTKRNQIEREIESKKRNPKKEKNTYLYYSTNENKIFMEAIFRALEDLPINNNIIPLAYKYCEDIFNLSPNLNVINSLFRFYALKSKDPTLIFNIYDELCQLREDNYNVAHGIKRKLTPQEQEEEDDRIRAEEEEFREEDYEDYYLEDYEEILASEEYDEESINEMEKERQYRIEKLKERERNRIQRIKDQEEERIRLEELKKEELLMSEKMKASQEINKVLVEEMRSKRKIEEKEKVFEDDNALIKFEQVRAKEREKERRRNATFKLDNIDKNMLLDKFNGRTFEIALVELMKHLKYERLQPIVFDLYLKKRTVVVNDDILFNLMLSLKKHVVSFESKITYYNPNVKKSYHTIRYIDKLIKFNFRNVIYKTMELDLQYHRVLKKINAPLLRIHEVTRQIEESYVHENSKYKEDEKVRMRLETYNDKYQQMNEDFRRMHFLEERRQRYLRMKMKEEEEKKERGKFKVHGFVESRFVGNPNELQITNDELVGNILGKNNKGKSYDGF